MKPIIIAATAIVLLISGYGHAQSITAESDVIAVVLDKKITATEKDQLNGLILGGLLEKFAEDNEIEPTDEELDAFVRRMDENEKQHQAEFKRDRDKLQKELKSSSLSAQERKEKESQLQTIESILNSTREMKEQTKGMDEQMRPMKRQMAQQFVQSWKINKAMYGKYGGRVIFQQAGFEPLDAYRDFLKEQEKNGAFKIIDKKYEAGFWHYFTNDAMHIFCKKEDEAKSINTPWWMMDKPAEK